MYKYDDKHRYRCSSHELRRGHIEVSSLTVLMEDARPRVRVVGQVGDLAKFVPFYDVVARVAGADAGIAVGREVVIATTAGRVEGTESRALASV